MQIIVNNKAIEVFKKDGESYVEGRIGSSYSIRITNPYNHRVLAIPSVDGLSIIDGEPASDSSPGYILERFGEISIPGWMVSNETVAKFEFSEVSKSYTSLSTGDNSNVGVIAVRFVEEKIEYHTNILRGIGMQWGNPPPVGSSSVGSSDAFQNSLMTSSVGTAFGEETSFKTTTKEFTRGNILGTDLIYYDTRTNLIKRGVIQVERVNNKPNPFPGNFCKPPKNWTSK